MQPGFKVEYAKSGRAMCRGCKKNIGNGTVRIARMVQSPFFDGLMPLWHHKRCLLKKFEILSLSLIEGLEDIRWEDQEKIRKEIGPKKYIEEEDIAAIISSPRFKSEYAKSGRSTCKGCLEPIEAGEVRIGKMVASERFSGMIPMWYHENCVFKNEIILSVSLVDGISGLSAKDRKRVEKMIIKTKKENASVENDGKCNEMAPAAVGFVKKEEPRENKSGSKRDRKRNRGQSHDLDAQADTHPRKETKRRRPATRQSKLTAEEPTDNLEEKTVVQLRGMLVGLGLSSNGKKAELIARLKTSFSSSGTSSSPLASSSSSPLKPSITGSDTSQERQFEEELRQENKALWAYMDLLKHFSGSDLKRMLEHNHMLASGGTPTLRQRCADAICFGVLPRCPLCKTNTVVFRDGSYECDGHLQWGRCTLKKPDIKRKAWKFSSGLTNEKQGINTNSRVFCRKCYFSHCDITPTSFFSPMRIIHLCRRGSSLSPW